MAGDAVVTNVPESEATRILREQKEREATLAAQNQPRAGSLNMTESDFNAALAKAKEEARKEEKEKLYNRLKRSESLEKANAELKQQVGSLETKLAAIEAKLNQQPAPQPAQPVQSVEQIPDNILKVVVETATSDLRKQVSDLTTMLKLEQENKRQISLQTLREQLIREANGKIIEALVTGTSEEELRANAEKARHEYEILVARIQPVTTQTVSAPPPVVPTTPATPTASAPVPIGPMVTPQVTPSSAAPLGNDQEAEFVKNVGGMTQADYSKNRTAVLKRLKEMYPTGQRNPLMA